MTDVSPPPEVPPTGRPRFRPARVDPTTTDVEPRSGPDGAGRYPGEEPDLQWRRPEPINDIVDRLMGSVSRGSAGISARLAAVWEDVVGADFAARSRPGSCQKGRLVVLVRDGATASRMRFITSQILQKSAQVAEQGAVTAISFRVSPDAVR